MVTVTFDTLKFIEPLKEAGVPEPQAKAFSTAVRESHEAAELTAKADLRKLEINLCHEIKESASNLKFELLKWLVGLTVAQAGLLIGLLKFFPIVAQ